MRNEETTERITLVGGGLAGSLLTIFLARRGLGVDVLERRPDMREEGVPAGRSINLALSARGIYALKQVGLFERIQPLLIPMYGRMIHALDGSTKLLRYGKDDTQCINSVSRASLNRILLEEADRTDNVDLRFRQKCVGYDPDAGTLQVVDEIEGRETSLSAPRVIGTDGSVSAVRRALADRRHLQFEQTPLEHGYKELTLPSGPKRAHQLEPNALHIWPRGGFMLIALPNIDGSFTCTLFLPMVGDVSFESFRTGKNIGSFFRTHFPDVVSRFPDLDTEFVENPTGALATLRCDTWHLEDRALLLGDAAHAMVPFFGQGMNCAFQDCTYLDEQLEEYVGDWARVFSTYETARMLDAKAICDMAIDNFREMRNFSGDPRFHLKKDVERALADRFPERFVPKYTLVTFQRDSYAAARAQGRKQERILEELCHPVRSVDEVNWERAKELVDKAL